MIRSALLGFWHLHAQHYIEQAITSDLIDLHYAWDEDEERGRRESAASGLVYVADLDELLAMPDLAGVIVQNQTTAHHDVIGRALRAGKHVFSDKVLATTGREARELVAAAELADRMLFVGLPYLYYDFVAAIKTVLDAGLLGRVLLARISNCHGMALDGIIPPGFFRRDEAGGGALIDLCVAGYLAPHLFGMPASVSARFSRVAESDVEDYASVVLGYDNGLIVTVDVSFWTPGSPASVIEVHGTEGSIVFRADSQPGGTGAPPGASLQIRHAAGTAFVDLPLGAPSLPSLEQWARCIISGTRPVENNRRSVELSDVIEAAYRAGRSEQPVSVVKDGLRQ